MEKTLVQLHDVVREVHRDSGVHVRNLQKSPATESLKRVLSGFQDTLNECWELLDKQRVHDRSRGAINNCVWHLTVKKDLVNFRDRIAVHNIKLSMALECLNLTNVDGLRKLILSTTEWLSRQIHHEPPTAPAQCQLSTPRLADSVVDLVPDTIHDTLAVIMKDRHGSLENIPLAEGVDEAVYHLDQATKKSLQENNDLVHTVSSILRAYWLLKATEMADEYRAAVAHPSFREFEAQLADFGMTLPLFFSRLEKEIILAHQGALEDELEAPHVDEIRDRIEQEKDRWLKHCRQGRQRDSLDPRHGKKVMQW